MIWDERRARRLAPDTGHLACLPTGQDVTALSHVLFPNAVPREQQCSQHDPSWGVAGPLGALRPCLETSRARATTHSTATQTPTQPATTPVPTTVIAGSRATRNPTTPRVLMLLLPPPPPLLQTCHHLSGRECDGWNHPRAKTPSPYISRKHAALRHSTTHSSHNRRHRLARPPPPTRSSRPPTPIPALPACKTSPVRPPRPSPTPPLPPSQRGQWPVAMTHNSATLRL